MSRKQKKRLLLSLMALLLVTAWIVWNPRAEVDKLSTQWQKVDQQGEFLSVWQGPWHCVLDKKTGLLWEVKTDSENIHDGQWTYSWFDQGVGVQNMGDCYFETDRCDTQDLILRTNKMGLCGRSNWRLPSQKELQTLVITTNLQHDVTIAKDFFPHTKLGDYWTRDGQKALTGIYKHLGEGAIAIDFSSGEKRTIPYRNAAFVRLVITYEQNEDITNTKE